MDQHEVIYEQVEGLMLDTAEEIWQEEDITLSEVQSELKSRLVNLSEERMPYGITNNEFDQVAKDTQP